MRLYFVRHGESQDDIEDCYGGIADFPLTDAGKQQASSVAAQLRDEGIDAIYTSPLSRANETAAIIAASLSLPTPIVIDDLQERNTYGVLSGVNKKRAEQLFARVLSSLTEKPGYSKQTVLGGEEYEAFVQRVQRALDAVANSSIQRSVQAAVVVTHGKFTQALFERVFRLGSDVLPQLGAINIVEYSPAKITMIATPSPKK